MRKPLQRGTARVGLLLAREEPGQDLDGPIVFLEGKATMAPATSALDCTSLKAGLPMRQAAERMRAMEHRIQELNLIGERHNRVGQMLGNRAEPTPHLIRQVGWTSAAVGNQRTDDERPGRIDVNDLLIDLSAPGFESRNSPRIGVSRIPWPPPCLYARLLVPGVVHPRYPWVAFPRCSP